MGKQNGFIALFSSNINGRRRNPPPFFYAFPALIVAGGAQGSPCDTAATPPRRSGANPHRIGGGQRKQAVHRPWAVGLCAAWVGTRRPRAGRAGGAQPHRGWARPDRERRCPMRQGADGGARPVRRSPAAGTRRAARAEVPTARPGDNCNRRRGDVGGIVPATGGGHTPPTIC